MKTHNRTARNATHTSSGSRLSRRDCLLSLASLAVVVGTSVHTASANDRSASRDSDALATPTIVVHSPEMAAPITGPVKIDVAFVPAGNVPIDPASFKVSYGFLGIDITERVRRYATVSADGIVANLPAMPRGKHTFEIQISDILKRSAHVRLHCEVIG